MEFDYQSYWESCWQEEDSTQLQTYLEGWRNYHGREIEVLKEHQVAKLVLPVAKAYGMEFLYLVCDEDNVASCKTIEKLGAALLEVAVPPKDYFGWYEGHPAQRIYKLDI